MGWWFDFGYSVSTAGRPSAEDFAGSATESSDDEAAWGSFNTDGYDPSTAVQPYSIEQAASEAVALKMKQSRRLLTIAARMAPGAAFAPVRHFAMEGAWLLVEAAALRANRPEDSEHVPCLILGSACRSEGCAVKALRWNGLEALPVDFDAVISPAGQEALAPLLAVATPQSPPTSRAERRHSNRPTVRPGAPSKAQ